MYQVLPLSFGSAGGDITGDQSGDLHLVWEGDESGGKLRWAEKASMAGEAARAVVGQVGRQTLESAEVFADKVDAAAAAAGKKLEEVNTSLSFACTAVL